MCLVVRQLLAVAARRVDVSRKKKLHPPPQLELTHQYQLPDCFACSKKVYPQEYTTAAGHPLHTACLKCEVCHHSLSAVTYCCYDNTHFFCRKHYMQAAALNQELDDLSTPTPIKLRENEGQVHDAGRLHGSSSQFRKAHTRSASIVSHASSSAFDAVKTRCGLIVDYEDTDQLQPLEQLPPRRMHTTTPNLGKNSC